MKVSVLGDGGWGTALALTLLRNGHAVRIWSPFPDYLKTLQARGENTLYLPGIALPPELEWTADRARAVEGAEVVVLAVPTRYFRQTVRGFRDFLPPSAHLVSVAKGLDPDTFERMSTVAESELGRGPVAALSGPSFAEEVARHAPTAVVIACKDHARAEALQAVFMGPRFRVYTSDDVVGVEMGGALKNVMAIGVGACDGLGFGANTRAALITRGLAEIARIGCALGAHPATFSGLSGMGDLVLTCTSSMSRNHTVGERLGRGESIEQILAGMKQVAEGVTNCVTAHALARKLGVAAPITDEVHAAVHNHKPPREAVITLLSRDPRPERDF